MNTILRIRFEPDGRPATLWLIAIDGATEIGLMHGHLAQASATKLADRMQALGMTVEREMWKLSAGAGQPTPETKVFHQAELFAAFQTEQKEPIREQPRKKAKNDKR